MNSTAILKALKHVQRNPTDRLARRALGNQVSGYVESEFVGQFPPGVKREFASMLWQAVGRILSRWEDGEQRGRWIRFSRAICRELEGGAPRLPRAPGGPDRPVMGLDDD